MPAKILLAKCDECDLEPEPFVPPLYHVGSAYGTCVLVGEAPGAREVQVGEPFIGKAGELLSMVLNKCGVARDSLHITNTCLCRPPANRVPKVRETSACRERLIEEIRAAKPFLIIALGRTAATTLLRTRDSILDLRRRNVHETEELPAPVLVTYHPAAVFRQTELFPDFVLDLKSAFEEPDRIPWVDPRVKILSATEVLPALVELKKLGRTITCDVETTGLNWRLDIIVSCAISWDKDLAIVIPGTYLQNRTVTWALLDLLGSVKTVYHNGQFDIKFFMKLADRAAFPREKLQIGWDTILAHYGTDERKGTHSLDLLAANFLGAPDYGAVVDAWKKKGWRGDDVIWPEVYKYNAYDAVCTYRLMLLFEKELEKDPPLKDMVDNLLMPASNALCDGEYNGVEIDLPYLHRLGEEMLGQKATLEIYFEGIGINPRSPQQIGMAIFGDKKACTDKEVLGKCDHPLATKVLEHRGLQKNYKTYIIGIEKHLDPGSNRLHSEFFLFGTSTGRTASRKPNLQNIPRVKEDDENVAPIRGAFVAAKGKILLEGDLNQAEYRCAAVLSNDTWLKEQFLLGRNFHDEVSKMMYGPNFTKDQRIRAKAVNFGLMYGRGAASIAKEYNIPIKEAKAIVDGILKQMPGLAAWLDATRRQALKMGYLTSPFGRHRRFWLITNDNKGEVMREAVNFPIQSMASDMNLLSLIKIVRDYKHLMKPVLPTIHDAIVVEIDPDDLQEAVTAIRFCFKTASERFNFPFPVDFKYSTDWGSLKKLEETV